jgi:hypothetical protein
VTVEELTARFPEIPADLRSEPALMRFAEVFADLLRAARCPSPCSTDHDRSNHYYLKLIGPLSIYGYGLATRESVLADIEAMIAGHEADPAAFRAGLLPADAGDVADEEVRGPGCG